MCVLQKLGVSPQNSWLFLTLSVKHEDNNVLHLRYDCTSRLDSSSDSKGTQGYFHRVRQMVLDFLYNALDHFLDFTTHTLSHIFLYTHPTQVNLPMPATSAPPAKVVEIDLHEHYRGFVNGVSPLRNPFTPIDLPLDC